MPARDPLRYFRVEARELLDGLRRGLAGLAEGDPTAIAEVLRHAHTLKGAARVVGEGGLAEWAHRLEGELQGPGPVDPGRLEGILREISGGVDRLNPAPDRSGQGSAAAPGEGSPAPRADTVRLEVSEIDGALAALREARAALEACEALLEPLRPAPKPGAPGPSGGREAGVEALRSGLERVRGALAEALGRAGRLRLAPTLALLEYLERAAVDAARFQGKQVRFVAEGTLERMDSAVLAGLSEALQHLVRNAVVHGIEAPGERVSRGKPPQGVVAVRIDRVATGVCVTVSDDGAGLRPGEVARVARERGVLGGEAGPALDHAAAAELLLGGGLSTAATVSALAGRGLGLGAARAGVEALGGTLALRPRPGGGTVCEIALPESLAALRTLALQAGGHKALMPFPEVREMFPLRPGDVAAAPGGAGAVVRRGGRERPYLALGGLLRTGPPAAAPAGLGVLVGAPSGGMVLGVDLALEVRESVVRPLPVFAPRPRFLRGVCLDPGGGALPVLDAAGLEAVASEGGPPPAVETPPGDRGPILVVDDSLTTRVLLRGILEAAGHEVDLAASGEEGLAKARGGRHRLVLADVEMPGMDGYALLRALAAEPGLAGLPAILVTSRSSPEDRARGAAAGARDIIVKGEFDQRRLLESVREALAWGA